MFFWKKSNTPAAPKAAPRDTSHAAYEAGLTADVDASCDAEFAMVLLRELQHEAQQAKRKIDRMVKAVERFQRNPAPDDLDAARLWASINRMQTVKFVEAGRDRLERDVLHSMNATIGELISTRCPDFDHR